MKFFSILGILLLQVFLFVSCGNDSPTNNSNENAKVDVTGDITESYNATATFGLVNYTSFGVELEYLNIHVKPLDPGAGIFSGALIFKMGRDIPAVGTYQLGEYALGQGIPSNIFGSGYTSKTGTLGSGYTINQGTITITESSVQKIVGSCNLTGYFVEGQDKYPTRKVTIKITFSANSDGTLNTTPLGGEYFEVSKDGSLWTGSKAITAIEFFGKTVITATRTDPNLGNEKIEFRIVNPTDGKEGTFTSTFDSDEYAQYQNDSIAPFLLVSKTGSYKVTKVTSTYIEGTFSFETNPSLNVSNSVIFTNGKFKANY
jgi:hypothetical protein